MLFLTVLGAEYFTPHLSNYESRRQPLISAPFEPNSINIIIKMKGTEAFFPSHHWASCYPKLRTVCCHNVYHPAAPGGGGAAPKCPKAGLTSSDGKTRPHEARTRSSEWVYVSLTSPPKDVCLSLLQQNCPQSSSPWVSSSPY